MDKRLNFGSFAIVLALLAGCASEPAVHDFNQTADPQVELDRVDGNIQQAITDQLDVLSPKNFEAAKQARDQATSARSDGKDQKYILHKIAVSQAYIDKANAVAAVSTQLLKGPLEARREAVAAKANKFYSDKMAQADQTFKDLTEQVEKNDTSAAEKSRNDLQGKYRELEMASIKAEYLGQARTDIAAALKEGAEKLTPQTLVWANKHFATSERTIENNRHDVAELSKASQDASQSAARLLKMVRDAKISTEKNPEQLALQKERVELEAASLANAKSKLGEESARNQQLEAQTRLDREFEKARGEFTSDEAEVYKQGDTLLLRMKGLSFPHNRASITSDNFPLLAKVQRVIGDLGSTEVLVEGHTDSTGSQKINQKLSAKRAESVESYLVANNNVAAGKITATGYGDSKPIATNKTAVGRAQNRRVDILIKAPRVASSDNSANASSAPAAPQAQQE